MTVKQFFSDSYYDLLVGQEVHLQSASYKEVKKTI